MSPIANFFRRTKKHKELRECYHREFKESSTFLKMLDDIGFDDMYKRYCIRRMMAITIRTSYYIFCRRNKEWGDP